MPVCRTAWFTGDAGGIRDSRPAGCTPPATIRRPGGDAAGCIGGRCRSVAACAAKAGREVALRAIDGTRTVRRAGKRWIRRAAGATASTAGTGSVGGRK